VKRNKAQRKLAQAASEAAAHVLRSDITAARTECIRLGREGGPPAPHIIALGADIDAQLAAIADAEQVMETALASVVAARAAEGKASLGEVARARAVTARRDSELGLARQSVAAREHSLRTTLIEINAAVAEYKGPRRGR
jgi:hypothetical protein